MGLEEKYGPFKEDPRFRQLGPQDQKVLEDYCLNHSPSVQMVNQVLDMARDLQMWKEPGLETFRPALSDTNSRGFLGKLRSHWESLKDRGARYGISPGEGEPSLTQKAPGTTWTALEDRDIILGSCPVNSPLTRCCGLQTLDLFRGCPFDCQYCSIRTFFQGDEHYQYEPELESKLDAYPWNPEAWYHIGTGQSSDSLVWPDTKGLIPRLFQYFRQKPRVILELKTKAAAAPQLWTAQPPRNTVFTWSLNPQGFIEAEELGSASLEKRLQGAEEARDRGYLVGFHFHPMVPFEGWQEAYGDLFNQIRQRFQPSEVLMISLGTLTYIKPVIRALRERGRNTRVLQMPLVKSAGKWTYPLETKKALFSFAHGAFSDWEPEVFLYLCMEDPSLWQECLGRSYSDNETFQRAMIYHYSQRLMEKFPQLYGKKPDSSQSG